MRRRPPRDPAVALIADVLARKHYGKSDLELGGEDDWRPEARLIAKALRDAGYWLYAPLPAEPLTNCPSCGAPLTDGCCVRQDNLGGCGWPYTPERPAPRPFRYHLGAPCGTPNPDGTCGCPR